MFGRVLNTPLSFFISFSQILSFKSDILLHRPVEVWKKEKYINTARESISLMEYSQISIYKCKNTQLFCLADYKVLLILGLNSIQLEMALGEKQKKERTKENQEIKLQK